MSLLSRCNRALARWTSPDPLPSHVAAMPGMTSYQERRCLYRAARNIDQLGQVIDLGSWLGSLTASLAAGITANPKLNKNSIRIYAYDTFVWHDWMDPIGKRCGIEGYSEGEDFLPEFEKQTKRWADIIEPRVGDVAAFKWDGRPIAILVIDAMKDEDTARSIVTNFFPSLVPGQSLVFQQDFAHFYTSWVHLIWWRIRDHLELIEDLAESGGSLYRYTSAIPASRYEEILDFETADDQEWRNAFENSLRIVRPEKRHMVAAAEIMRFLHAKRGSDAAEAAMRHKKQGNWGSEIELVMTRPEWKTLAEQQWKASAKS